LVHQNHKRYIGITSVISKRLFEHNSGHSTYTHIKGPWSLLWTSRSLTHTEALQLEKRMKKQKGGTEPFTLTKDYSQGSSSRGRRTSGSNPAPATKIITLQ